MSDIDQPELVQYYLDWKGERIPIARKVIPGWYFMDGDYFRFTKYSVRFGSSGKIDRRFLKIGDVIAWVPCKVGHCVPTKRRDSLMLKVLYGPIRGEQLQELIDKLQLLLVDASSGS